MKKNIFETNPFNRCLGYPTQFLFSKFRCFICLKAKIFVVKYNCDFCLQPVFTLDFSFYSTVLWIFVGDKYRCNLLLPFLQYVQYCIVYM